MFRYLKTCWLIIVSVIFTYYAYTATVQLHSRGAVTNCKFRNKATFPDLTICTDFMATHCNNASSSNPKDYRACQVKLFNTTTSEIFRVVPTTLRQLDEPFSSNGQYLQYSYREFLKSLQKCIQVRFIGAPENVSFSLFPSSNPRVYITANDHYTYPYDKTALNLLKTENRTIKYKFRRVETQLLPAPYSTECFDYGSVSQEGQGQCLEKCLLSETSIFSTRFLSLSDDSYRLSSFTEFDPTHTKCFQKCDRTACVTRSFLVGEDDHTSNSLQLKKPPTYFFVEAYPVIVIEYIPLFSGQTYFLYICSLFCMCFGLSSLSFKTYILLKFKKFLKNKIWYSSYRFYKKILNGSLLLLAFAGFATQFVLATYDYFSYATLTELFIGSPLSIEPPATSICFTISNIPISDNFNTSRNEEQLGIDQSVKRPYVMLNRLTLNESSLILGILDFDGLPSAGKWDYYFKGDLKCFVSKLNTFKIDAPVGIYTWLNIKHKLSTYTFLHAQGDLARAHYSQQLLIEGQMSMTYDYLYKRLLSPPYGKCDGSLNFKSHGKCFESCMKHKIGHILPAEFMITVDAREMEIYSLDSTKKISNSSYSLYVSMCKTECLNIICEFAEYEFSRIKLSNNTDTDLDEITVNHPKSVIELNFVIKQNTVEYLLFVASILAFWYGFSIIMLVSPLIGLQKVNFSDEGFIIVHPLNSQQSATRFSCFRKFIKQKLFRSCLKRFTYICLIIACIYHTYDICNFYLAMELVTETKIMPLVNFIMPTLSICFPLCSIFKGSGTCHISVVSNFSAFDLNLMTYTFDQLFEYTSILDSLTYRLVKTNSSEYTPYFMNGMKCFRIVLARDISFNVIKTQTFTPGKSFAKIRISDFNNTVEEAYLYLHQRERLQPFSAFQNNLLIHRKFHLQVGFVITNTYLLPAPYSTKCVRYNTSRQNCIESCIQRKARTKFNASNNQLVRFVNDTWPVFSDSVGLFDLFRRDCSNRICVKNDCISQNFNYINKGISRSKNMEVSLVVPEMMISSKYVPKLNSLDLSFYLGGIFGLWLNISYLSIFDSVANIYIDFKNRNRITPTS